MSPPPPPLSVLAAFGAAGLPPVPLAGGQGTSWRAGDLVLKPSALDPRESKWQADVYAAISCHGFRVARPRSAADGSFCVDGWCASEHVAGRHQQGRWPEIIAVGERFHAALADVGARRPAFLDERADPWAISDRVAWGEIPTSEFARVRHLPRLAAARRPVTAVSQLMHGDLTGNVLFDDHLPPAIIDLSPYWRPPAFASAIVVADALVFEGAGEQILDAVRHIGEFGQYLIRALIFRTVTNWLFSRDEPAHPGSDDPWSPAADLACRLADAHS